MRGHWKTKVRATGWVHTAGSHICKGVGTPMLHDVAELFCPLHDGIAAVPHRVQHKAHRAISAGVAHDAQATACGGGSRDQDLWVRRDRAVGGLETRTWFAATGQVWGKESPRSLGIESWAAHTAPCTLTQRSGD